MAALNPLARELVLKIVFYGPGLGGKTTTLQHIHDRARPEHRGKMVSLATAVDRTLYFDFLPLRVPKTRGMSVRLQLFTVPGQVYYNSTRKLVLTGADGIVFVADSQSARHDANLESLENLVENLRDQNRTMASVPHVLLYNKRDLDDVLEVEALDRDLNAHGAPSVASVATQGTGVFEGLALIIRSSLDAIQRSMPPESAGADLSLSMIDEGLAQSLRGEATAAAERDVAIVSENVLEGPESRWSDGLDSTDGLARSVPPARVEVAAPRATEASARASDPARAGAAAEGPARPAEGGRVEGSSRVNEALTHRPPAGLLSFASLWGDDERERARQVEVELAAGRLRRAVELLEGLAQAVLSGAAAILPAPTTDLGTLVVLLGVRGERYLAFRALLRDVRAGASIDERAALGAYLFVLELRQARGRIAL